MESHDLRYPPPKYVMLSANQGSLRPPPYRRNLPRYESKTSRGSGCLRCICCCYFCLFFFTILFFALTFFLYTMYKPKVPSYAVENFNVQAFNFKSDMSLFTEFAVTIKADNPNENIGFVYGKDSLILISYSDSDLCSGKLPAFYQPEKNLTEMSISLQGTSPFGSGLQEALMENRHTGRIPLLVRVKAPVSIVLGKFPLRTVDVYVNCSLVIDNLSPNKKVRILSAQYTYDLGFNWY